MMRLRGFTLIELLLVIAIAGITLGLVSLKGMPGAHQSLQDDAQRLALLMQLAGDEAVLRNRSILLEADGSRYRFLVRAQDKWVPLVQDELLRPRDFTQAPLTLQLTPQERMGRGIVQIVFAPRPIGRQFLLTLSSATESVGIRSDGLGQYQVE
ncbi:MAG TPA: type II secretion system minor pseudopilin GspH [Herminiimonas sp.]|nr:type II secretion system minor pseudopilin GspH [Herminiimonas sp.]